MRPWNMAELMGLWATLAAGAPLSDCAIATDRLTRECDLAAWAMVGRTPEQALARLNAGLAGGGAEAPPLAPLEPVHSGDLRVSAAVEDRVARLFERLERVQ